MLNSDTLELNVPGFYPKQIEFMKSKCRYTAYGGARGGGQVSHSQQDGK